MKWLVFLAAILCGQSALAADAKPFARGSWQEIKARYENKPMVVHLWGLTCAPCLTELQHWASVRNAFPEMNFVFIAADPAPMPPGEVEAELEKAGIHGIDSWNFADRFTQRLRFEIDQTWKGELPRTLLIDKDGTVTVMPGVADLGKVKAWIAKR
ncbi:MAG: TlpA disulfide reductase family protein [Rhodospirillaceae bacterium]